MKDKWDKFKIATEGMKNIKWLFPALLTLVLGSGATNIGQFVSSLSFEAKAEAEKTKAIHEVATGFQAVMAETEPKAVKSTCSSCSTFINTHIRKEH